MHQTDYSKISDKALELLAPAGSMESLHGAVQAGANAVYLGLDEFNARRNAHNFTLETLKEACDYAHLRKVKVYVTMNVEILPHELERAMLYIQNAWECGADAFIIQDVGLAWALHRLLPSIPVHLSTQMNIHNKAGIELAAALGASRVTLARELSITEIAELACFANDFSIEVECFIHGALCVCYSGQCLMSSMIGGRSANRGLCAQACRLPYDLYREDSNTPLAVAGEHLLSPKDLCALPLLRELAAAGVTSFKIEGRMKSADYVYEVVSVYREALDNDFTATEKHQARLAEAFSRGFTTAYLEGYRNNDIMSYTRPNNRGVFVGRVQSSENGKATIKAEIDLHVGDLVEFWTNRGHFTASIEEDTPAGKITHVTVEKNTGKGDRIFRVRNAQMAFVDNPSEPLIPLVGKIALHRGQPAYIHFIAPDGTQAEAWGDTIEEARTKELTEEDVFFHINRLGQTPYSLRQKDLDIDIEPGIGMSFSSLHRLRSEALKQLSSGLLDFHRERNSGGNDKLKAKLKTLFPKTSMIAPEISKSYSVVAWVTNPGCARSAKKAGATNLYVPILNFRRGQAQICGVRKENTDQAGYPKQCIMALPTINHDPMGCAQESGLSFDIWDYVREEKTVFVDNLGDALRALSLGAKVEIGPHIPITNAASLDFLAKLGISRVWLSPELTLGQIAALAEASPLPLGITVSGAQELMVTEHCLLMSQGSCNEKCENCSRRSLKHHLTDRKGFDFPVVTDAIGRSHLYNGIELDAVPTIPDFIALGISNFMVDTTLMNKETAASAVRRVIHACDLAGSEGKSLDKRVNTTTGHLFRGVQ